MQISEFDFELPAELIAQVPLSQRDASRMLVVDRRNRTWTDSEFKSFPRYLDKADVLVLNNTKVIPARLIGERDPFGGAVEVLLLRELEPGVWLALVRPAHRLKVGARMRFGRALWATVIEISAEGRVLRFEAEGAVAQALELAGETPLPPYIKRPEGSTSEDRERYQTIYAQERGAIAAPTAGLHFTPNIFAALQARQVKLAEITLHVGYGTFEPVRAVEVSDHRVAPERYEISQHAANIINNARAAGGRIVAVGTTTTRALEAAADQNGQVLAGVGNAALTIVPGYNYRVVDALLTNFHLPRSSLLLLVSAFAGSELVLNAYHHAVADRYRFYSYGDCMFLI